MEIIDTVAGLRAWNQASSPARRVLVPTMGALHEGHLSLCDLARREAGTDGRVVVSIFVNPLQFGPGEDFEAYPRNLEEDAALCAARAVDAIFAPSREEAYFEDASVTISERRLSRDLCGKSRPGHFDGVCTVVAKLFNLAQPDAAVFGKKDYQQLMVIRRMVRDLNFPVEILEGPIAREADGLALSSRNQYLNPAEREQAPVLFRSLGEVARRIGEGELRTPREGEETLRRLVEEASLARMDYGKIVHPITLAPLEEFGPEGFRLLVAAFFGRTRLIDNLGDND